MIAEDMIHFFIKRKQSLKNLLITIALQLDNQHKEQVSICNSKIVLLTVLFSMFFRSLDGVGFNESSYAVKNNSNIQLISS